MRRFYLFLVFVLVLIIGFGVLRYQRGYINLGDEAVYSFYVSGDYGSLSNAKNITSITKNGNTFIVSVTSDKLTDFYASYYPYIFAFSAHFNEDKYFNYEAFKREFKVTEVGYEELVSGTRIYYGNSSKFCKSINANGQKINVQVAFTNDGVYVGFPLIVGSY